MNKFCCKFWERKWYENMTPLIDHDRLIVDRFLAVRFVVLVNERCWWLVHDFCDCFENFLLVELFFSSCAPCHVNLNFVDAFDLDLVALQVELTRECFTNEFSNIAEDDVRVFFVYVDLFEELEEMNWKEKEFLSNWWVLISLMFLPSWTSPPFMKMYDRIINSSEISWRWSGGNWRAVTADLKAELMM